MTSSKKAKYGGKIKEKQRKWKTEKLIWNLQNVCQMKKQML